MVKTTTALSQRRFGKRAIITILLSTGVLFAWVAYRYHLRGRALTEADRFVTQYVSSLNDDRYSGGYAIESKAVSDGPFWLYDTGFQYILAFSSGRRLYLHVTHHGGGFSASSIDVTDKPEVKLMGAVEHL